MVKTKTIGNLFTYLDIYSNFLPTLFILIFWKRNKLSNDLKVVFAYTLINFLINYLLIILSNSITILYESFTPIEYLFFSAFLYLNLKGTIMKRILIIFSITYIIFLFFFYYYFTSGSSLKIDSIPIGIETILILIFSFYYLYEQANDTSNLFIYSKYAFWIVLGMVIYLAGCFFIYIFANQLTSREIRDTWYFTNIFSILKNVFFSIAFILNATQSMKKNPIKYNVPSLN